MRQDRAFGQEAISGETRRQRAGNPENPDKHLKGAKASWTLRPLSSRSVSAAAATERAPADTDYDATRECYLAEIALDGSRQLDVWW